MYLYGFKTYGFVCDAAAPNVSVVKATTGVQGAYGNSEVKFEFKNPFDPTRKVYWIICPSHQVHTHRLLCCTCTFHVINYLCIICMHNVYVYNIYRILLCTILAICMYMYLHVSVILCMLNMECTCTLHAAEKYDQCFVFLAKRRDKIL